MARYAPGWNDTWWRCTIRCPRRTGVGMRPSRRRNLATAACSMWRTCSTVMRTPSIVGGTTWRSFPLIKRPGASEKKGGRKKASIADPELVEAVETAVAEHTAGSPVDEDLLWTNRSPRQIAEELEAEGFSVCADTVRTILRGDLGLGLRQA